MGATHPLQRPQECRKVKLDGEVSQSQEWSAPIGEGWLFRLVPIPSSHKENAGMGYSGWDLVVSRVEDGDYPDALLLATPPYRSVNEREVGTTYGMRAQDAIAWTPRRFQFLTSASELKRARELYEKFVVAPPSDSGAASKASGELLSLVSGSPTLGRGVLTLLDARLVDGAADPPAFALPWAVRLGQVPHTVEPAGKVPSPRGELRWIRFNLELQLPAAWKLPPGMWSKATNCAQ